MFTNDYSEKNRQLKKIVDKKIKKVMNIGDKYCKMKDSRIVECITYPQKKGGPVDETDLCLSRTH
ncbi:hypothetical protein CDIMF43_90008 [Carnobacterium divergens]|nr:hypothetical protein CDIMF43_90008 [Carnobacterium divergens]